MIILYVRVLWFCGICALRGRGFFYVSQVCPETSTETGTLGRSG